MTDFTREDARHVLSSIRERLASRSPEDKTKPSTSTFTLTPPDPELALAVDYVLGSPKQEYHLGDLNFSVDPEISLGQGLLKMIEAKNGRNSFKGEILIEIARATGCPRTKMLAYCLAGTLAENQPLDNEARHA